MLLFYTSLEVYTKFGIVSKLFYFPPYSPEYNPDELLNSDIKRNAGARQSPRTQTELEANVQNWLNFLLGTLSVIASFSMLFLPSAPLEIHELIRGTIIVQHHPLRNRLLSVSQQIIGI